MTSFDVIRKIRKVLPRKTKIGHLGTLDPMASGVLPLAVGDATRLLGFLEEESKSYLATMQLGSSSDTQDAWGTIKPINDRLVTEEEMLQTLQRFTGIIEQIPPMYSAVHHQGQRLYELARQGIEVERTPRPAEIIELELLDLKKSDRTQQARIRVVCSRGTYVRTLCHDIGNQLGTGAYMSELVRTHSGAFPLDKASHLDDIMSRGLRPEELLPLDYPLTNFAAVYLSDPTETRTISHGGWIPWSGAIITRQVRIYSPQLTMIGIGNVEDNGVEAVLKPIRVLAGSLSDSNT